MQKDIIFITELFKNLIENNIDFCILRNVDEVANGDAHDIDMVVNIEKREEYLNCLNNISNKSNWKKHIHMHAPRDKNNIERIHFYNNQNNDLKIVHFDIFWTFCWKGYVLLENKVLLENIVKETVYHAASKPIESITQLFVRLLHNGYVKEKYKENIKNSFIQCEREVKQIMLQFLSKDKADSLYIKVCNEEWSVIESEKKVIVADIIRKQRQVKRLFIYLANQAIYLRYLILRGVKESGIMVAFQGTDGSGKSTIINGIPVKIERTFNEDSTEYYHWRPGFIKSPKKKGEESVEITNPHALRPYNKIISFMKFMYFNADFILGYLFKVRWQLAKGRLVIFDRYYYDYLIDKYRYRLDIHDNVFKYFNFFIPKPNITFLLIGDSEVLYNRKKEISICEIEKQQSKMLKNKNAFHNPIIIDSNQSIDDSINEVCICILNKLNKRY